MADRKALEPRSVGERDHVADPAVEHGRDLAAEIEPGKDRVGEIAAGGDKARALARGGERQRAGRGRICRDRLRHHRRQMARPEAEILIEAHMGRALRKGEEADEPAVQRANLSKTGAISWRATPWRHSSGRTAIGPSTPRLPQRLAKP